MHALAAAAGTVGFLAVAFGAFGAHFWNDAFSAQQQDWWGTATLYALVHSASALGLALHGHARKRLLAAGWAFVVGTALFAGSLYAMALGAPSGLGAVTPAGGVLFLAGWGLVASHGIRPR